MVKNKEKFDIFKDSEENYFSVQNKEGSLTKIELAVIRPTYQQQQEAQAVCSKTFYSLISQKIPTKMKMEDTMRKNGEWDEQKEKAEKDLIEKINKNRLKLRKGKMKLSEAVKLCKDNIKLNFDYMIHMGRKNQLLTQTADSLSEQERFNYLVSVCTVYNETGSPFFKSYEDFLSQDVNGSVVTYLAGQYMSSLLNNLSEDYRKDWLEYQLLLKYGVVDSKLRWLDKDKNLVDEQGNKINEKGQRLNADGSILDDDVLPDSEPVFLDDNSEEIQPVNV